MEIIDNTNKQEFSIHELKAGEVYKVKGTDEFVLAVDYFMLKDSDCNCTCYAIGLNGCGLYTTPYETDCKFILQNAKLVIE